jgi:putative transcriptional regulator
MSAGSTTKKMPQETPNTTHDWSTLDAMTDAEKHAAALSDPDAQPITEDKWQRMKPVPRAKTLRRALGLSQEEFSATFQIPLGTLRDWEQGRAEPDQAARAYLKVIAAAPDVVRQALSRGKA